MKNLVEDIHASTRDRLAFVKDIPKDVKELLARYDNELKEMAAEVKKFLAHSEKARKEDFAAMMKDIVARQKDIRKGARELVEEYAADSKKAHEYWMSRGGHQKVGHPKREEKE